jgi:hypothetical protein
MGFAHKGVWVMGYCGPMGYGMHFPTHQVGGQLRLWDKRGYGSPGVWVKRGSTVVSRTESSHFRNNSITNVTKVVLPLSCDLVLPCLKL